LSVSVSSTGGQLLAPEKQQSLGVQFPPLHGHGQSVWTYPGIPDALYAGTEWLDWTILSVIERRMHLAAPVRVTGSRTDSYWQLDPVLQWARPHQSLGYVAPRAHPALVA